MIVVIGSQGEMLCRYLQTNGLKVITLDPEQVPSLTALLLDRGDITDIVIPTEQHKEWSMGHVLAAAKHLQGKGRMVFLGCSKPLPALISVVPNKEALLKLLMKPAKPAGGNAGNAVSSKHPVLPEHESASNILPMKLPSEKILFIGVVGSQQRIGCTTQAVGLWHYCKALGFDAAVVSSPAQIAEIAGPMHSQEIPGGYRIEGIPFVADTALAYDCYILDIGAGNIQESIQVTDLLVLVAGSKPWELQHTAAALRAARGKDMLIMLSFSSQNDADCLQPLFGRQTVTVMPWMPELWKPSVEVLMTYDTVLRPALQQILARDERHKEENAETLKGDLQCYSENQPGQ